MRLIVILLLLILIYLVVFFKKKNIEYFNDKYKIAFIFLTVGNIKQIDIWKQFFKNNEQLYSIYIHPKYPNLIDPNFKKYIIKDRIFTKWGDISLVNATNLLIKNALKDTLNKKIVLVSDSCIPIKTFKHIYNSLLSDNKSWFNYYKPSFLYGSREHLRRIYTIDENIRKKCYITDQWMILDRKHALSLYENKYLHKYFTKYRLIPDEMYYISMLHIINPNIKGELKFKISGYNEYNKHDKVTYAKWYDPTLNILNKLHPIEFNIMKKNDLINLKNTKCLFARKFSKNSNIDLYWKYIIN